MTIRETACILKFGFLLKYFTKSEIGNWADKKIMENCKDINIVELTFIENKTNSEALTLIDMLIGDLEIEDKKIINNYYLGFFRDFLNKSKKDWLLIEREVLRYYSMDNFVLDDQSKFFISALNNDFSLREDGFSGEMKMPDKLLSFLEAHKAFEEMHKELDADGLPRPHLARRSSV